MIAGWMLQPRAPDSCASIAVAACGEQLAHPLRRREAPAGALPTELMVHIVEIDLTGFVSAVTVKCRENSLAFGRFSSSNRIFRFDLSTGNSACTLKTEQREDKEG